MQRNWSTAGGNEKWSSHHRKVHSDFLKKINMELMYDPAIPLLGIYTQKGLEADTQIDYICTCMFIAALSTITQK
jgi:hypothetical protein